MSYYELFDAMSVSELLEEFDVLENESTISSTGTSAFDDNYYNELRCYLEDNGYI